MATNKTDDDNRSETGIPIREFVVDDTSDIDRALPNNELQRFPSKSDSIHSVIFMSETKTHITNGDENNRLFDQNEQQPDRELPREQLETLAWWKVKSKTVIFIHLIFTVALLLLKIIVAIRSGSMSIRSLVGDSAVDLVNLSLLLGASYIAQRKRHKYPLGRTNIETLAILAMAVFMTGMLGGVIFQAGARLWTKYQYFFQHGPAPERANITVESVIIVGALVLIKLFLLLVCIVNKSAQATALKKDHQIDILMNLGALLFGYLGSFGIPGKWTEKLIIIDDIGAICLAIYGIVIWAPQIREHVRRACHRIVKDDDAKEEIRQIASDVLTRIGANGEVSLGETIMCHGGGDKIIIMQMITLPDNISHPRVRDIFSQLKTALVKGQNAEHVLVHWEL